MGENPRKLTIILWSDFRWKRKLQSFSIAIKVNCKSNSSDDRFCNVVIKLSQMIFQAIVMSIAHFLYLLHLVGYSSFFACSLDASENWFVCMHQCINSILSHYSDCFAFARFLALSSFHFISIESIRLWRWQKWMKNGKISYDICNWFAIWTPERKTSLFRCNLCVF